MQKDECVARWMTPEGVHRRRRVLEMLRVGDERWPETLIGFPGASEVEHNQDLRGLDFGHFNGTLFIPYADASWANFSKLVIRNGNFNAAKLLHADFTRAQIFDSLFTSADARWATFSGARVVRSYFDAAQLSWVNFDDADLDHVDLSRSDLTFASFKDTREKNVDRYYSRVIYEPKHTSRYSSEDHWLSRVAVFVLFMIVILIGGIVLINFVHVKPL